MRFDIYLVGVGGQGILTVGEILAEAARNRDIPANFYPSKGMAQRGGFVKAQLRLGREIVGPNIPERSADLVIGMEVSEALKGIRFIKPGGDFILFGEVWETVPVLIRKKGATYPEIDRVKQQIVEAQGKLAFISADNLPQYEGTAAAANIFILGAAVSHTKLGKLLAPEDILGVVEQRWKKGFEANRFAFQSGLEMKLMPVQPPGESGGCEK